MTKKRTKNRKVSPNYSFLINWNNSASNKHKSNAVNRETALSEAGKNKKTNNIKSANISDKPFALASAGLHILKSLIVASLILGMEVVLYFVLIR